MRQVEPPSQREWLPFGGLIRRKLGSRLVSVRPETSCDQMQIINKCSVISRVNNLFTIYYLEIPASKVIVGRDELCASNGEDGMTRERLPFPPVGHGSHAAAAGTNVRLVNSTPTGRKAAKFAAPDSRQNTSGGHFQRTCDKASPAAAVMLHLRSCYVSKAAILTVPALSVPVENRSPA